MSHEKVLNKNRTNGLSLPGILCNRNNTHIVMKKAKIKIQCFSEITKTTGTFLVDMEGEQLTPTYESNAHFLASVLDLYPLIRHGGERGTCIIDDQPLIPLKEINQKFIHLKMNL